MFSLMIVLQTTQKAVKSFSQTCLNSTQLMLISLLGGLYLVLTIWTPSSANFLSPSFSESFFRNRTQEAHVGCVLAESRKLAQQFKTHQPNPSSRPSNTIPIPNHHDDMSEGVQMMMYGEPAQNQNSQPKQPIKWHPRRDPFAGIDLPPDQGQFLE